MRQFRGYFYHKNNTTLLHLSECHEHGCLFSAFSGPSTRQHENERDTHGTLENNRLKRLIANLKNVRDSVNTKSEMIQTNFRIILERGTRYDLNKLMNTLRYEQGMKGTLNEINTARNEGGTK